MTTREWEFLVQKEGDQDWLALEAPTAEILEGRYRLMVQSRFKDMLIDVQIRHIREENGVPKRLMQRRSHTSNSDGRVGLLPYTYLRPGLWKFSCRANPLANPLHVGEPNPDLVGADQASEFLDWCGSMQLSVLQSQAVLESDWDLSPAPLLSAPASLPQAGTLSLDRSEDITLVERVDLSSDISPVDISPVIAQPLDLVQPDQPNQTEVALQGADLGSGVEVDHLDDIAVDALLLEATALEATTSEHTTSEHAALEDIVAKDIVVANITVPDLYAVVPADVLVLGQPVPPTLDQDLDQVLNPVLNSEAPVLATSQPETRVLTTPAPETPTLETQVPTRLTLDCQAFTATPGQALRLTGQVSQPCELMIQLRDALHHQLLWQEYLTVSAGATSPLPFACTFTPPHPRTGTLVGEVKVLVTEQAAARVEDLRQIQTFTITVVESAVVPALTPPEPSPAAPTNSAPESAPESRDPQAAQPQQPVQQPTGKRVKIVRLPAFDLETPPLMLQVVQGPTLPPCLRPNLTADKRPLELPEFPRLSELYQVDAADLSPTEALSAAEFGSDSVTPFVAQDDFWGDEMPAQEPLIQEPLTTERPVTGSFSLDLAFDATDIPTTDISTANIPASIPTAPQTGLVPQSNLEPNDILSLDALRLKQRFLGILHSLAQDKALTPNQVPQVQIPQAELEPKAQPPATQEPEKQLVGAVAGRPTQGDAAARESADGLSLPNFL
jgi:hypothetical protein